MDRIVFLAIGSMGDVLPLAKVAKQLSPASTCVFITHLEHNAWLSAVLAGSGASQEFVTTSPAQVWNAPLALALSAGNAEEVSEDDSLEEYLKACMSALGIPGSGVDPGNSPNAKKPQAVSKRLLVHNLFAMEVVSIAEALGVPSLALSPCLVPQAAPASLQRQLKRAHPALHAALTRPEEEQPGCVRWADVEHWLWPLFSAKSRSWRQERLGLSVPFSRQPLIAPPRLLYLLSPCLTQELPYWPQSVQLCGHTLRHSDSASSSKGGLAGNKRPREEAHDGNQGKAQSLERRVLMDFGSVGCMGLLGSATRFLQVIQTALETAGLHATLLTGQWKALQEACSEAGLDGGWLQPVHGFVDHSVCMRCSSMAVHHGGMGTMLAALEAGLPAVACPLHYDQHQNADLLEHLELGSQVPGRLLAHGDIQEAAARLAAVMCQVRSSARLHANAQSMQQALQQEDGAASAAAVVRELAAVPRSFILLRQAALKLQHAIVLPNGWHVHHSNHREATFIYKEIFKQRCYIQHGIMVRDGDICVDVGANVGFFTLFLLGGFAGGMPQRILCCEPAPANMKLLRRNVEMAGVAQKVTLLEKALGREAASSVLTYYPEMPGNSTLYPEEKALLQADSMPAACSHAAETHSTEVVTLQSVLEGYDHVDLLKIDAEGAELEILNGAGENTLSTVRQIVTEVHDIGDRPFQVQQLLERAGFKVLGQQYGECRTVLLYAAQQAL